jgi:GcrA cell cycle regulator
MQSNWAPAHSEALREFFVKGMSFSAIAGAINAKFNTSYTRNAVLGRATRMGLALTSQPQDRTKPPSITETSRILRIRERANTKPWRLPPVLEATETAPLRCVDVVSRDLSLMDLERGDCRYPYGGDADGEAITFCGHRRRRGSSYCTAHFKLSRGPGTASERAAVRILLKFTETAADQTDPDEAFPEFANIDYSRE